MGAPSLVGTWSGPKLGGQAGGTGGLTATISLPAASVDDLLILVAYGTTQVANSADSSIRVRTGSPVGTSSNTNFSVTGDTWTSLGRYFGVTNSIFGRAGVLELWTRTYSGTEAGSTIACQTVGSSSAFNNSTNTNLMGVRVGVTSYSGFKASAGGPTFSSTGTAESEFAPTPIDITVKPALAVAFSGRATSGGAGNNTNLITPNGWAIASTIGATPGIQVITQSVTSLGVVPSFTQRFVPGIGDVIADGLLGLGGEIKAGLTFGLTPANSGLVFG